MLGETTGLVKIGIINTMGVRKDPRAVSVLEKQVYSDKEMVAKAAAAALGEIGNQDATTVLQDAMNKTSGELHNVVLDAYLKCADQYLADNQSEKAFNIYQTLYAPSQPDAIQAAAIRGMVFSDMQKSEQHIIAGMKNSNSYIKSVAIGLIKDLPKPVNLQSFAEEFDQLEAKHKVQLLTAFADVGGRSVQSTVKSAVQDENTNVRIAALNALKVLGDANSVMTLARTAADKRDEEREAARESLYRLSAPNVNQTIIKNISTAEPGVKIELINSLGERDATEATDELLKISRDADGKVRVASLKVLGQIAGPKYLSDAIGILEKAQTDTEREAAVQMVTDIAQKTPEKDQQADKVMARLDSVTDPEVKSSLLRVLGKVGDPDALSVLRDALDDGSEEIKTAAIRALSDWPTTTPMDDLLNVAQTADDEIQQVLALRGYIDFIKADQKLSDNDKVQRYQKAMQLAQNTREKQMALSGLAELNSLKALQTATGYLDNVTLKQEAEMAVFQIARSIRRDHPAEAKSALKQVLAQTDNAGLKEDAKRILDAID
jgi:HEAT repeat protein